MQVKSSRTLNDKESVNATIKKLSDLYSSLPSSLDDYERINKLIAAHNDDDRYNGRIWEIYELVKKD